MCIFFCSVTSQVSFFRPVPAGHFSVCASQQRCGKSLVFRQCQRNGRSCGSQRFADYSRCYWSVRPTESGVFFNFSTQLESEPRTPLPIPNQTRVTLRNEHLNYIVTWLVQDWAKRLGFHSFVVGILCRCFWPTTHCAYSEGNKQITTQDRAPLMILKLLRKFHFEPKNTSRRFTDDRAEVATRTDQTDTWLTKKDRR